MLRALAIATLAISLFSVNPAQAVIIQEKIIIKNEMIKDDQIKQIINDFCSITKWHPLIADCKQSQVDGAVKRLVTMQDGTKLIEQLLFKNNHQIIYISDNSPFPTRNYVSQITINKGSKVTSIVWRGMFDADGKNRQQLSKIFKGVYAMGLNKLKAMLISSASDDAAKRQ